MFTGTVGRIRMDVDVRTEAAMAKVAALAAMVDRVGERGNPMDLFTKPTKSFRQLGMQADRTYESINSLVTRSYFLQSAISALVPVVAQLVAGLFALGSQAAAAAPALIVLPSIMTAMMQAAITAKLALGGVFKAVGELGKAKTPAVDQMPRKLEAFRDAQERVRRAQEGLNRAYREAAERLQQLGFDTEDAAIAQERAALALEDARNTLARVQDLPPNSRARQEAELAFKEADLNYRRAIDRSNDLTEEQDRVTQNGTLNAEEQVNQSEEVLRAQEELRKSVLNLKKAQDDLNKSQTSGGGASEFSKLSKEAQAFAKYLAGLKPEIQALKDAAGKEMFGPLQEAIQNLVDNFFPRLKTLLQETGKAFGETMLEFSKIVTEENNLKNFETVGRTNIDTIGKLGKVVGNLYSAFLSLLAAADPLVRRFTDWVVALTGGWKATAEADKQSGKLTKTFEYAGDVAAQLGDIIGNLIGGLMNMGKAAAGPGSGGEMIFDALERNTEKFKQFTKTISEDGTLQEYFKQSSSGFLKVAGIIGKILKIIFKSATQEGTTEFLDSVSRAVDTLGVGFEHLAGSAPYFGKFIEAMARLIVVFTESGSIIAFFKTLTSVINFTASIFENELVAKIFKTLAVMHGFKLAMLVVRKVLMTLAFYILGMIRQTLSPLIKLFGYLTSTVGMSTAAVLGLFAAVAAIIYLLIRAYAASENFRKAIADLGSTIWGALVDAVKDVREAFSSIFGGNAGKSMTNGFKNLGDFLAAFIVPLFKVIIPFAINILKNGIIGLMKIIGGIIKITVGLFDIIMGVVRIFTGDFSGAWEGLSGGVKKIIGGLVMTIKGLFQGLIAFLIGLWPPLIVPITLVRLAIAGIGAALSFVWNSIISPILGLFGSGVGAVANAFSPVIDVVSKLASIIKVVLYAQALIVFTLIGLAIAGVWRGLKKIGVEIWQNLIYPLTKVVLPIFRASFGALKKIFEVTFQVLLIVAGAAFVGIQIAVKLLFIAVKKTFGLMLSYFKFVFNVMGAVFNAVWPVIWGGIKWAWENVIRRVFEGIMVYYKFVFNVIKTVFNAVWPLVWGGIQWAWENVIKRVFTGLMMYYKFVFNVMKTVFNAVWPLIWGGIQWAWENIIKKVFSAIGSVFSFVWRGVLAVFNAVWPLIWGGIQFAWNSIIKPVFDALGSAFAFIFNSIILPVFNAVWPVIWGGIKLAWNSVIKPVFDALGEAFSFVFNNVILPVFNAVWPLIWQGIQFAWNNVIKPIFDLMGPAFAFMWRGIQTVFNAVWPAIWGGIQFAWNNVIKPIIGFIGTAFGLLWAGIKLAFTNPWEFIKSAISFLWTGIIQPIIGFIGTAFGLLWEGIKTAFTNPWGIITGAISFLWTGVIQPVIGFIGTAFGLLWEGIKTAFTNPWEFIKNAFTGSIELFKTVFGSIWGIVSGLISRIIDGFMKIPSAIGKAWDLLKQGVFGIINLIIKAWNNTLGTWNFKVPKWVPLIGGQTFGFGKIPLLGSGESLNVENVITGGYRRLGIGGLAKGGTVLPQPGGSLFNIAEAGRPERVEPLDPDGLSKRDKAMIKLLAGGPAGGVTINVHPSPGMDEVELAALVNRQLAFELRKGAA